MMGAGIAYVCARAGMEVVLKDVSLASAEKGKDYSRTLLDKAVSRGKSTRQAADEILARIIPTDTMAQAKGADLLIEAVFEDPTLKHQVYAEVEPLLAPDALLGSNTSTLPITKLAAGVDRPEDFIGLHFFSPVDKMPLLEIVVGEKTSDETLARAIDVAAADPEDADRRQRHAGLLHLPRHRDVHRRGRGDAGRGRPRELDRAGRAAGRLPDRAVGADRRGVADAGSADPGGRPHRGGRRGRGVRRPPVLRGHRSHGAGVRPRWPCGRCRLLRLRRRQADGPMGRPGRELRRRGGTDVDLGELSDRMLFIEAIESQRCLEEGVLRSVPEANIGSIFGIGYPAWTGGVLQFIDGYPGGATLSSRVPGSWPRSTATGSSRPHR